MPQANAAAAGAGTAEDGGEAQLRAYLRRILPAPYGRVPPVCGANSGHRSWPVSRSRVRRMQRCQLLKLWRCMRRLRGAERRE